MQKIKIMRKLFVLGLVALLASCGEDTDTGYQISGTVANASEGQKIIISELNDTNTQTVPIDTVTVTDGEFEVDLPEKEKPTISFLTLDGLRGNVLYIAENTPISFELYADSLYASNVTGGENNRVLYNYLGEIKRTNEQMQEVRNSMREAFTTQDSVQIEALQQRQEEIVEADKEAKRELVEQNPNSLVAVMVLQDMVNTKMYSVAELRELYNNLSAELQATPLAQNLDQNLKNLGRTEVGSIAPDFSGPTPEGDELALKDVLGEVTLVDFWASWCKPCRVENPNIVDVYEKYHDEGFNILQVSLDRPGEREKWLKAIEDDNLDWNHVSNLMFWQDPIAAQYGVRAIPAAFLLNEKGEIVAKDLRGEELEEKVAELLND